MAVVARKPTFAFIAASWTALLAGSLAFLVGLWRATMQLNEKGFYFTVLMYGLFSAVSVQKAVRDRQDGVPVTNIYYGLSWFPCCSRSRCSSWAFGMRHSRPARKAFTACPTC